MEEAATNGQPPHMALLFVLKYLDLHELLIMSKVCRSFRDTIREDVLLWLDIVVDRPLNRRLSDDVLMEITSKSRGRLTTLALLNCQAVTDDGLQKVVENNPLIEKLYVPGCSGLSPEGVIRAVTSLTERNRIKALKISGIYNVNKEHLATLSSYFDNTRTGQKLQTVPLHPAHFYHSYKKSPLRSFNHPGIDVEMCPRCNEVKMVFDCPREGCNCRGCYYCIPRCEECGECTTVEEEVICNEVLCSTCWLQLPKCIFCNRSYCRQHWREIDPKGSTKFMCEICDGNHVVHDYEI